MSFWTSTSIRTGRAKDGAAEIRHVATLHHHRGGTHTLTGPHAASTLAKLALRWNRAGFDQPAPTRAAGDRLSGKARSKFFLSSPAPSAF
jgi:hypothetical protein